MKKTNAILTVVLVAVSIFLLWLWYYLGFNQVDAPLDLVLSVVWWVIVAAGIAFVVKTEKTRQRQIRTVYLADDTYFNSEAGVRTIGAGYPVADSIAQVLASLEYGFDRADEPGRSGDRPVDWKYVIHTDEFKPGGGDGSRETWEGDVVTVATGDRRPFSSREELARLIA